MEYYVEDGVFVGSGTENLSKSVGIQTLSIPSSLTQNPIRSSSIPYFNYLFFEYLCLSG